MNLTHVPQVVWNNARARERENETHPCDDWQADACMCKGACSCHWIEWLSNSGRGVRTCISCSGKIHEWVDHYALRDQPGVYLCSHCYTAPPALLDVLADLVLKEPP